MHLSETLKLWVSNMNTEIQLLKAPTPPQSPPPPPRVAKCHRYGRLICVNFLQVRGKILECNIRASGVGQSFMKTASFIGVILPQTPVHLAQILGRYSIWVILTQALEHLAQML